MGRAVLYFFSSMWMLFGWWGSAFGLEVTIETDPWQCVIMGGPSSASCTLHIDVTGKECSTANRLDLQLYKYYAEEELKIYKTENCNAQSEQQLVLSAIKHRAESISWCAYDYAHEHPYNCDPGKFDRGAVGYGAENTIGPNQANAAIYYAYMCLASLCRNKRAGEIPESTSVKIPTP